MVWSPGSNEFDWTRARDTEITVTLGNAYIPCADNYDDRNESGNSSLCEEA